MALPSTPIAIGRLTHGPQPNALAIATTTFVYNHLKAWRDRPGRPPETDEERLNAQLTRHLNGSARQEGFPAIFQHEENRPAGAGSTLPPAPPTYKAPSLAPSTSVSTNRSSFSKGSVCPHPGVMLGNGNTSPANPRSPADPALQAWATRCQAACRRHHRLSTARWRAPMAPPHQRLDRRPRSPNNLH